ncbi:MAG TPA: PLP-dependent aminotransferase family protein [Allosphingosinicella sp.]
MAEGPEPLYQRLADSIQQDIASGTLASGSQLPTHRELARSLGLGLGTVSKAYALAEQRGLISGQVGRGSFVTAEEGETAVEPGAGLLDLARNFPPPAIAERRMAQALGQLRARADVADAAAYTQVDGLKRTRVAAAQWLRSRCGLQSAEADRLIQCNGGQHGLTIALAAILKAGDTLLCDSATFFGVRMIAEYAGYRLHGVAMDGEGMTPEALEATARASGARAVYLTPTLQNPTARTLSAARRRALAQVAERAGLTIVEDDVYRPFAPAGEDLPTFADLLPERTFHVTSLSKSICPGLRLGFIMPPDHARAATLRVAQAFGWSPSALGGLIFAQWAEDGSADAILQETLAEVQARAALALEILGPAAERPSFPASLHLWLPLPLLDAERAAGRAMRAGVEVTPIEAALVSEDATPGIRLCLGGIRRRSDLAHALKVVRDSLSDEAAGRSVAYI